MTLRARLILMVVLAVLALATLGGIAVYSVRAMADRLYFTAEAELAPAIALNNINSRLHATRSRMLAVALGTYSPTGARLQLADDRADIIKDWARFMAAYRRYPDVSGETLRGHVEQIERYMPTFLRYLDRIDAVAERDDREALTALMGDDWAALHIEMVKPLRALVIAYEEKNEKSLRSGRVPAAQAEQVIYVGLAVSLALLLLLMLHTMRRIALGVGTVQKGLQELARNRYRPMLVSGGDEVAQMLFALNATAKQLADDREEILALKRRNELIIESLGEGLYGTDIDGNITFINPAGARMIGWEAAELIGKPAHATMHHTYRGGGEHRREDCPLYHSMRDGRRHESGDDVFWRRDGTSFDVRFVSTPMIEEGRTTGAVVVYSDISAARKAEQELRDNFQKLKLLNERLEAAQAQLLQSEKMASIGQLAAGVAHEINNPIGFVNSNLNTLKKYSNDMLQLLDQYAASEHLLSDPDLRARIAAQKQALDLEFLKEDLPDLLKQSEDGLQRVKKIVQDLKDFSHVDEAEWQLTDINAGLESTLNIVWNEIKYKTHVVKAYGSLPPVECLAAQVNQVFMNLIVNAAHAMASGKDMGNLTLTTGHEDGWVWVDIADTGCGMSAEVKKRIFEPFYTTKPVGKGTGLGLSVSYNIIQKHGGRIEVDSTEGHGTRFRVWLPVAKLGTQPVDAAK